MAAANRSSDFPEKRDVMKYDPEEYSLRKRLPRFLPKRKNDIYVNTKTSFPAQIKKCKKLLDDGENEIYIHGLGLAVDKAINIALQLKSHYSDTLILSANTATVNLVDDFVPESDEAEPRSQVRSNSAVHIKIFRPTPVLDGSS